MNKKKKYIDYKSGIHNDTYYHVEDDLNMFPDAWCYVIWSARGKGKTYSALKYAYENDIPIIYMKRTIDDVNLICAATENFDPSPYVPINRDTGYNIKPKLIREGIGAFYKYEDGEPYGLPVAYCLAESAIKKFKGFDFSRCKWIVFDEFIPQIGERISKKEGQLLLDLYMTVQRDRMKRGFPELKLILFANAEEISTPITNELEIVDIMADLNASGQTHYEDEERHIMLHHITNEEFPMIEEEKGGIFAAMKNTAWGQKSFYGSFANNDFSNVNKVNLKRYKGYIHISYRLKNYYIYYNEDSGHYYMCKSRCRCEFDYNLDKENDQKRFFIEHQADLWNACTYNKMTFQKYSMYDLIMNYKKFFNVY